MIFHVTGRWLGLTRVCILLAFTQTTNRRTVRLVLANRDLHHSIVADLCERTAFFLIDDIRNFQIPNVVPPLPVIKDTAAHIAVPIWNDISPIMGRPDDNLPFHW